MTKLHSLISHKTIKKYQIKNLLIKGITCDSRKVKKGYIFAVFKGFNKNGISYINQAIENGASAILIDKKDLKEIKNSIELTIIGG